MSNNRIIIVNFKANEKHCIDFIEKQSNYSNAIKYLIMKEIHENGLRNLNKFIPSHVSDEYFDYVNKVNINNKELKNDSKVKIDKQLGDDLSPIPLVAIKNNEVNSGIIKEMNDKSEGKEKNKREIKEEFEEELKEDTKVEIIEELENDGDNDGEIGEELSNDGSTIPDCYL